MASVHILLPWPTSTNALFRHTAGKRVKTGAYREFRKAVGDRVLEQRVPRYRLRGRIAAALRCYPPNRAVSDIDNRCKATFDALTAAGVIEDDSIIDLIVISRGPVRRPGAIYVRLEELAALPPELECWPWFAQEGA